MNRPARLYSLCASLLSPSYAKKAPLPRALTPLALLLACVILEPACGRDAGQPFLGPPLSAQSLHPGQGPSSSHPGPADVTCPEYSSTASPFPADDLASPFQTAVAGTIPGAFSVTGTGEASYTMPLVSPPGRAGVEPRLALAYSSADGDGVLGMGFSIAGLSAISRCPARGRRSCAPTTSATARGSARAAPS